MRLTFWNISEGSVRTAEALAQIATLLGETADATLLKARGKELGDLINKHMWVEELGVYSNGAI